jgi:hypothetical protein
MDTLDKLRGKFFNKNSFNVGFNNRSPLNYITSSGPTQPTFNDTGMRSFEPDDWKGAFDTSDAVRAETKAEIAKQKGYAKAAWDGIKLLASAGMGGAAAGAGAGAGTAAGTAAGTGAGTAAGTATGTAAGSNLTGFQKFVSGADNIFSGQGLQNANEILGTLPDKKEKEECESGTFDKDGNCIEQ